MNTYKALNKQVYTLGSYSLVPIRMQDRYDIMQWRNEQIYHLRQAEPLTEAKQDAYFEEVISALFDKEQPNQILFSFLKDDVCIGYGGLVHINWVDKNAEISFIMNTDMERDYFDKYWQVYLQLIEEVAFKQLDLHKIFTYAFDLRPHLYPVFEKVGFVQEAKLTDHILYQGNFVDVIIHGKVKKN